VLEHLAPGDVVAVHADGAALGVSETTLRVKVRLDEVRGRLLFGTVEETVGPLKVGDLVSFAAEETYAVERFGP
jgi:ribosomal protein S28E/S33